MTEDTSMPSAPLSAEAYVKDELAHARAALQQVKVFGSIIVLVIALYLTYVAVTFADYMKPESASGIATTFVSDQIDLHKDEFVANIGERVPAMVDMIPTILTEKLSSSREELETQFGTYLTDYTKNTMEKLSGNIDAYIDDNKDKLKTVIEAGKDEEGISTLGKSLNAEIKDYLKEKPDDGPSIDEQVAESLKMITTAEKKIHRLATAKNLTPAEKKTRHAIALIAGSIDKEALQPITLPKFDENAVDEVVEVTEKEAAEAKGEASKADDAKGD